MHQPPETNHTAVWTGTEMIIWGGESGEAPLTLAGDIIPAPTVGPDQYDERAAGTSRHTAVWTGRNDCLGRVGRQLLKHRRRYHPRRTVGPLRLRLMRPDARTITPQFGLAPR